MPLENPDSDLWGDEHTTKLKMKTHFIQFLLLFFIFIGFCITIFSKVLSVPKMKSSAVSFETPLLDFYNSMDIDLSVEVEEQVDHDKDLTIDSSGTIHSLATEITAIIDEDFDVCFEGINDGVDLPFLPALVGSDCLNDRKDEQATTSAANLSVVSDPVTLHYEEPRDFVLNNEDLSHSFSSSAPPKRREVQELDPPTKISAKTKSKSGFRRPNILSLLSPAELEEQLKQTTSRLTHSMKQSELSRRQLNQQESAFATFRFAQSSSGSFLSLSRRHLVSYTGDITSMTL